MAVVYKHLKKDSDEVFYIGIGSVERSRKKSQRNKWWNNVVNKYGYDIEIIHYGLDYGQAQEFEKFYIMLYGRRDLNQGTLVNLSHGGEGNPTKRINEVDYSDFKDLMNEINTHRLR